MEATQTVLKLMQEAAATHAVDLIMLPELCPFGYSEDTFAKYLPTTPEYQAMYEQIDQQLQEASKTMDCAICYGTIGWNDQSQFFIRQVVADASGSQIASYDKIHLCNYGDCAETRFFTPGEQAVSFTCKGWKFGLMICADIRYPVLSRRLVKDHQVDVLLQPACFARDISFRTWQSFRETRAVENGAYFLAGNYAGCNYGEASMVPPWVDEHHEPEVLGTDVGYLMGMLDRKVLQQARTELPFHKHLCETKCCD
jgi:predicted amidohydrolase